jgi:hypothetical protein
MTIAGPQTPRGQGSQPKTTAASSAAVWIDGRSALIAMMEPDGRISTCEIDRGIEPELSYLAIVVHAIGDRERVLILGPSSTRLALEREYVAIYRRPDRLIDVEPGDVYDRGELVQRLYELAG